MNTEMIANNLAALVDELMKQNSGRLTFGTTYKLVAKFIFKKNPNGEQLSMEIKSLEMRKA